MTPVGNIKTTSSDTLSYDVYNRSNVFDGIATTYDALGRAVERGNNGTYTQVVYSPTGDKLAFMNGQSVQNYFIPLVAGMKAVYNASGLQWFRHVDWLGSTWFDSKPDGTVYFDGVWAPFGEHYAGTGTSDRSFTGQTSDTLISGGYYDFPFRQYSSTESRWLNPDPAGLAAVDITNPQTWNRYAYVMNNPVANKDPLGLYCAVGIACSQGGGSYDAFATVDAQGNAIPGGVYAAGSGSSLPTYGGQSNSDPCGGWCSPPSSLLGNITASQDAFGEQLYQEWEIQALQDLANQAASSQDCQAKILTAVNSQFGTNFTDANVQSTFMNGGAVNLIINGTGLTPSQFNSIQTGRSPNGFLGAVFGYGPSLHITGPAPLDPQAVFNNSNIGGETSVTFTAHIDSAWADNPIGALLHYFIDVLGQKTRNPCP